MNLTQLKNYETAIVRSIESDQQTRQRIMDMGLVPGKKFKILRVAPLGDPIEIDAGEFLIALRKEEAEKIIVEKIDTTAEEAAGEKAAQINEITSLIDSVLLHRFFGLPIFLLIMWLIFQLTFRLGALPTAWLSTLFNFTGGLVGEFIDDQQIRSFVVDGVIAGVGGVLVYLPNILIFFLALSFLELSGYMNRASFVVDKVMHKIGLSGGSFLNMVIGFGCSVPAMQASNTIKSKADRLTTMMIIPFMSCGAKLPIYVLLISAFFPVAQSGNILFAIYILGVLVALSSAFIIKKFIYKGKSEAFVISLPEYKMPSWRRLLQEMWSRARVYLKKAATVILIASMFIWTMSNYPQSRSINLKYEKAKIILSGQKEDISLMKYEELINVINNHHKAEQLSYSIAGRMGKFIEPAIRPLGFDWRIGISLLAGLAGKEVVVSSLSTIYSLSDTDEDRNALKNHLRRDSSMNPAVALSLMVFVLLYIPCMPTAVLFHKQAGHWKRTLIYLSYTMSSAWIVSFVVYRIASLFI